jgi:hypothetical protein
MYEYLKIYDNVIEKQYCHQIIDLFEEHPEDHIIRDICDIVKFTEININLNPKWSSLVNFFVQICKHQIEIYKKDCNLHPTQFPEKYGMEQIRLKRYLPNDHDEFCPHVDALNVESSKRYLSFLFYLNNVKKGGETVFGTNEELIIKPKQGSLLMFPPLWTHIHAGKKTISENKYIATTYINFL